MAEINRQYKEVLVRVSAVKHTADKQEQNTQSGSYQTFGESSTKTRDRDKEVYEEPAASPPSTVTFTTIARNLADVLVSDSMLDRLERKAQELIESTARRMIRTGVTSFRNWKANTHD